MKSHLETIDAMLLGQRWHDAMEHFREHRWELSVIEQDVGTEWTVQGTIWSPRGCNDVAVGDSPLEAIEAMIELVL